MSNYPDSDPMRRPITTAGMAAVLKRLDAARLLGAGATEGMAAEWQNFLEEDCRNRHRTVPTLATVLTAASRLANRPENNFAKPADLWGEVWAIARENVRNAQGGEPLQIPPVVAGEVKQEQRYRRLWRDYAGVTGDGGGARAYALAKMGLADQHPQLTAMPQEIREQIGKVFGRHE